jgi:hypothetical protein
MKTYFKIVDAEGDEIDLNLFKPFTDIDCEIVDVTLWTGNGDPDKMEVTYTLRYLHDK